jgi:hypothetical protein
MGDGASDLPAFGLGDRARVGGAFGGEGAFHLGEQHEQQGGTWNHYAHGGHDM